MITVKENTVLVGISELRVHFSKVLSVLGKCKVLLERRHKPVAVIVPVEQYEQMEAIVEMAEDLGLGYLAKERDLKSKPSDYVDLGKAEKIVKVR